MARQIVLFQGGDAAGHLGLWESNGTASGTFELTGIAGANANGLDPFGFTFIDGEALFHGLDAAGHDGLWETDGTAAGTHELTGIAGASANGLAPTNFLRLNGELLFDGIYL